MSGPRPPVVRVERSIVVEVPVRTAYNRWARFEDYPSFLGGVESVERLDPRRLRWRTSRAGEPPVWEAVIADQMPDSRITWRATTGPSTHTAVSFHWLEDARTRVVFRVELEPPEGPDAAHAVDLGLLARRIEQDLSRFRSLVEESEPTLRRGADARPERDGARNDPLSRLH